MSATAPLRAEPLRTVHFVETTRLMGKWYEIAAIPHWLQKDCVASTTTYHPGRHGDMEVIHNCRIEEFEGKEKTLRGSGTIIDQESNAKFEISFLWPFSLEYWVIEWDSQDYQYAVLGDPARQHLWIIAREPHMDPNLLSQLVQRIERVHGYDSTKIVLSRQPLGQTLGG